MIPLVKSIVAEAAADWVWIRVQPNLPALNAAGVVGKLPRSFSQSSNAAQLPWICAGARLLASAEAGFELSQAMAVLLLMRVNSVNYSKHSRYPYTAQTGARAC